MISDKVPSEDYKIRLSRSDRSKQRQTCLLIASIIVVNVVLSAVVGLVAGLGAVRSEDSDDCSPAAAVITSSTDSDFIETDVLLQTKKCPVHPSPSPLSSAALPERIKLAISSLQTQLENLVDPDTMPGLVASITYRDEQLWSRGFGVTQKGTGGSVPTKDTIYRIASVSKVFAVLTVYQLYDHGLVHSLDDPLNMYCPNFYIHNPFTRDNITLRQIITSMSGLPREAPCGLPQEPSVNLCPCNTTTILERLSHQSTILPPWTKPSYSNLGFALLGWCLVPFFYPHMSYEDYVEQHILKPLGMNNTGFNYTHSRVLEQLATGYVSDGSAEPVYDVGWWTPSGQMYSTLQDLNKLAQFFYSVADSGTAKEPTHSNVLSPTLRRMMLLPTYTNRDLETGIGTPWEIRFQDDYTVIMKGGNLRGYSALFSFVPDLQLGLNILFSGAISKFSVTNQAYATLIPAFVEALMAPSLYPLPPNTTTYTGVYTAQWSDGKIAIANVHLLNNNLVLSGSAFSGIFLAYREPFRFQIEFSDNELSCLSSELLAIRHTWLYFDRPQPHSPSEQSNSFTMPGFSPGLHFKRI